MVVPNAPAALWAMNSSEGLVMGIIPSVPISNSPISSSAPKRFLSALSTRMYPWLVSFCSSKETSTACLSSCGPAKPPSLVTWLISKVVIPRSLAMGIKRPAAALTCATDPGELSAPASMACNESMTTMDPRSMRSIKPAMPCPSLLVTSCTGLSETPRRSARSWI